MNLGLDNNVAVVAGGSRGCGGSFLCSRQAAFLTGETIRIDGATPRACFENV